LGRTLGASRRVKKEVLLPVDAMGVALCIQEGKGGREGMMMMRWARGGEIKLMP